MGKMQFTESETSVPRFLADDRGRDQMIPGGMPVNPASVISADAIRVQTTGAAQGATSVPLAVALTGPIPAGVQIVFDTGIAARLTAAAAAGASAITVEALGAALTANATAYYSANPKKRLAAGSLLGATFAEVEAGTALGPAVDGDDRLYIVAFDNEDIDANPLADVLSPNSGVRVKVNYLPGWATLSATLKGKVRAQYVTVLGD